MDDRVEGGPSRRDRVFMVISAISFVAMMVAVVVEFLAGVSVGWILLTALVGVVISLGSPVVAGLTDPDGPSGAGDD